MKPQKRGRDFDKEVGKTGKKIPLSGAGILKGDEIDEVFLIEKKSTTKGSYSLKLALLHKIKREAGFEGKLPRFDIEFDSGSSVTEVYCVLPKRILENLMRTD